MTDVVRTLRILLIDLVDDDRADAPVVARILRQAGLEAEIEERCDGASALEVLRQQPFDCVIVDDLASGTNGISLVHDLRESGVGVPIVALTDRGSAAELMQAGATDYLDRATLTPEQLERSLRYAVALRRSENERQRLLDREQQARLQAQAANRAKDEFLATLSHELRTPLNAILGWAQLLAGGRLDRRTAGRAVEIIERNTRAQARLIDDLLDISRIATGKLRLEHRAVSMRSIVQEALAAALGPADAKRVVIDTVSDDGADVVVCDPSRMRQVIANLLSNAIKFTPEGGRIHVIEERCADSVVLTVTDTGIGIETEFLPHVFDRFRQQDAACTRKHGGLGLGLFIVRHIVELHRGAIAAFSEGKGRGATFVVTLPLTPPAAGTDAERDDGRGRESESSVAELPSLTGVRVLVVDNEPDARGLVSAILEGRGADVTAVESAADALREITDHPPDVLLSDIAMPGEDGYALIRKIRELRPSDPPLPAAALTAFATAQDRAQALRAGYQVHLPKPIEPAELTAVVASLALMGSHLKALQFAPPAPPLVRDPEDPA